MKTATDIRALQVDQTATFHAYVKAATGGKMNAEQQEAFGRDVYQIALVAVLDNGFGIEAKQSFPRNRNDFSLPNLEVWAWEFTNWFDGLARPEQKLFLTLKFIP